jgi:hypothetical protein
MADITMIRTVSIALAYEDEALTWFVEAFDLQARSDIRTPELRPGQPSSRPLDH